MGALLHLFYRLGIYCCSLVMNWLHNGVFDLGRSQRTNFAKPKKSFRIRFRIACQLGNERQTSPNKHHRKLKLANVVQ